MTVYILHLSELAVSTSERVEIISGGANTVLNALPPRRRAALFGRRLPFRVIVVNDDCRPVLVIEAEALLLFLTGGAAGG